MIKQNNKKLNLFKASYNLLFNQKDNIQEVEIYSYQLQLNHIPNYLKLILKHQPSVCIRMSQIINYFKLLEKIRNLAQL